MERARNDVQEHLLVCASAAKLKLLDPVLLAAAATASASK
jgi:hypothetical protein